MNKYQVVPLGDFSHQANYITAKCFWSALEGAYGTDRVQRYFRFDKANSLNNDKIRIYCWRSEALYKVELLER